MSGFAGGWGFSAWSFSFAATFGGGGGGALLLALAAFALLNAFAALQAQGFKQLERSIEVVDPRAHLLFHLFGNMDGGGFAIAGLADGKGAMASGVVGGAQAVWFAAFAHQHCGRAVKQPVGACEQGMESGTQLTFGGGERGTTGHGQFYLSH